jgi:hypothetical protein
LQQHWQRRQQLAYLQQQWRQWQQLAAGAVQQHDIATAAQHTQQQLHAEQHSSTTIQGQPCTCLCAFHHCLLRQTTRSAYHCWHLFCLAVVAASKDATAINYSHGGAGEAAAGFKLSAGWDSSAGV